MTVAVGHLGEGVRADCRILLGPSTVTKIDVRSSVKGIYGRAIEGQVFSILEAAGICAEVVVEDAGALPFTIAGRVESALQKAFPSAELPKPTLPKTNVRSLRRTRLYLPGNTPKFFPHASLFGADALIFDLEDSVPEKEKDDALALVSRFLSEGDVGNCEVMIRVNDGPRQLRELATFSGFEGLTVLVPKVESATSIPQGFPQFRFVALLESAKGMLNAAEIAAVPHVDALAIGLEDYTSDIGASRTEEGIESWWAYGQIVNSARAYGKQPLASSYTKIDDHDGLFHYVQGVARFGFEGVGCIHPGQVDVVHAALRPSDEDVENARGIVNTLASGDGVASFEGQMIDAPVVAKARRTLELAGCRA
ncbi:MAG TPA: aldolase/citrate lyase family protein [Fimbriimonadaceae bacterium]|nr:aldolase/citrate lyase family protein [Fimbriimonadaceae bacterium]